MAERDWIQEADAYLKQKYVEFIDGKNGCLSELPEYSPPLASWEAKYFMLGLEKCLFSVDHEAYVKTDMLYPATKKNDKQRTIQLIWNHCPAGDEKKIIRLYREGVCQMATASYLSIHHQWNVPEIEMEPKGYNDTDSGVDILLKESKDTIAICCEVKSSKQDYKELIRDFKYCCERGGHKEEECKYKDNHPKFDMCWELRPKYFYAISPEDRQCFELTYVVDAIQLHPIDALPTKVEYMPKRFLHSEFWILSWMASMPRPRKLYDPKATEPERKEFRQYVSAYCEKYLLHQYINKTPTDKQHRNNIEELQSHVNHEYPYKKVLYGSHFNIGVAQKLLNLQLKYLWCMGDIKTPPHCPVDSIILKKTKLKGKCNWTEMDSIDDYKKVIEAIAKQASDDDFKNIAEWELCKYRRRG